MAGIHRRDRKGNAAFTAVSIIALLSFATLTVDIGHARMTRAQIQNAVDAAAHAAISDIDKTAQGLVDARAAAKYVGGLNKADGSALVLTDPDIVFGTYDWDTGVFTPGETVITEVNAVVVSHRKLDIDAIFALVSFGEDTLGAAARSLAVVPAGTPATAVNCYLPFAAPACKMAGGETQFDFQASNNTDDTAGWARLNSPTSDANASMAFAKDQLAGVTCEGGEIGDTVSVMNGVGSAGEVARDRINCGDDFAASSSATCSSHGKALAAPDAWPEEQWPDNPASTEQMTGSDITTTNFGVYGIGGPIMLVEGPDVNPADGVDDFCGANPPNWTGDYELVGFAFGMLYDGKKEGNDDIMRFRLNKAVSVDEYSEAGGGEVDYGITYTEPPRFVPLP